MINLSVFVFILFSAFLAEVIGSMAGFGAATILTSLAGFVINMKTVIALVAIFHVCGDASRSFLFRKHINWFLVVRFGSAGIILSVVGAFLTKYFNPMTIKGFFGLFLIVYVLLHFLGKKLSFKQEPKTAYLGGMGAGFISGLIGTGGPIRSACLLSFHLDKETYLGTSAMIALLIDVVRVPVYLAHGYVTREWLFIIIGLVFVALTGACVGKMLVMRLSHQHFIRFVYVALGLVGLKFFWDWVR